MRLRFAYVAFCLSCLAVASPCPRAVGDGGSIAEPDAHGTGRSLGRQAATGAPQAVRLHHIRAHQRLLRLTASSAWPARAVATYAAKASSDAVAAATGRGRLERTATRAPRKSHRPEGNAFAPGLIAGASRDLADADGGGMLVALGAALLLAQADATSSAPSVATGRTNGLWADNDCSANSTLLSFAGPSVAD